ncbi:MAG: putative rane-associated protein [Candidatus Paceibacter sp.]|jgi:membrane-associated protein|nr:putative rane-associated protein [Candidatus Paceibacter sp.]
MHNLTDLIINAGYVAFFVTIFAESGFLLGFFLPGDSLLFTAGIFAAQGYFNIYILIIGAIICAIAGDSFGYYFGKKAGDKLFNRPESRFFKREYVEKTQAFYQKHGTKTIILARFVPIVRTFAPIMAGVGSMKYRIFITYNVIGGVLWAGGILLVSYFLGTQIPGIEDYLEYIIIGILLISVLPIAFEILRARMNRTKI